MELTRRGMLGGFAAVSAVGVVGFAGAASVTDAGGEGTDGGDGDDGANDEERAAAVDPDAPFEAQLLDTSGDDDDGAELFDARDLAHVQGPVSEGDEHPVYVALSDRGIDAFQTRLGDAGATDDPAGFVVSMTLDEVEVRRVDLDDSTVDALTDEEWGGVLTLPFDEEAIAEDVYESLATE